MKLLLLILGLLYPTTDTLSTADEDNTRYILIEAPCKSGFAALPDYAEKVILTKVFKVTYDTPFELVNAEPDLITDFEVALEKAYPNSRNQIKDILVYMITTEKEARELYKRKLKQFKTLNTGVIELKVK